MVETVLFSRITKRPAPGPKLRNLRNVAVLFSLTTFSFPLMALNYRSWPFMKVLHWRRLLVPESLS